MRCSQHRHQVDFVFFLLFLILFLFGWARPSLLCRLSLVAVSGSYSPVSALGLLTVCKRLLWLWSTGPSHMDSVVAVPGLQSTGSIVVAHRAQWYVGSS